MRHYAMWPLLWSAACGAEGVALFGERDLVNCPECRTVVARAEYLARPAGACPVIQFAQG